ncbi:hypothetical protein SCUCBS95973_004224 [Sporothrix curviconia]|uniref:GDP/GTP exchange factor Sec2 N-terminal domain-containing protein n=1 Tax=Sporothrix curviconia TaxID=1260050 RepID=A0ABP0BMA9_9PEZI
MTLQGPPAGPAAPSGDTPHSCPCPQCGFAVPLASDADALLRQAQQQIQALEAQVVLLDQKAAAAIDRWADYEDELTALRKKLAHGSNNDANTNTAPMTPASPTRTSFLPTGAANRLSALLSPRPAKSTPNLKATAAAAAAATGGAEPSSVPPPSTTAMPPPPLPTPIPTQSLSRPNMPNLSSMPTPPLSAKYQGASSFGGASSPPRTPGSFPFFGRATLSPSPVVAQRPAAAVPEPDTPSTKELLDALTREQKLRRQAESRLQNTSHEIEELSVSLFEQANEMVAEERRARARLEARVAVLEQRDTDKKRRLERLEQAMDRIERLRAMLGVGADGLPLASTAATPKRSVQDDESSLHEKRSVSANA